MTEKIPIKVKIVAEKKERFHNLKKRKFTKGLFNIQRPNVPITNIQIDTTPTSAFISWQSQAESFDVLVKGNDYSKAETITSKAYRLTDLNQGEQYVFSIKVTNGRWKDYQFIADYNTTPEVTGTQHKFTLLGETITDISNDNWTFEQTIEFDTKQIARFLYENNDSEKWHVEFILNDKIVAKSNKSRINANIRIGNYVITPIKSLSLQNRTKMIFGSQLTGLMRRNPDENLLQLEQQDFPEEAERLPTVDSEEELSASQKKRISLFG